MQNDSFKMRQHYAPYNRSEESHRRTDGHILFTLVVGYFAYAQYDVKARVEYFACAQYDVKAHVGYFADAQYDVFFATLPGDCFATLAKTV